MSEAYDDEFENVSDTDEHSRQSSRPVQAAAVPVPVPVAAVVPVPVPLPVASASNKSEADRAVEAALESGMWKKQFDAGSQKHYYFHVLSKATTWDLAKELGFGPKKHPALSVVTSDASSIVSPQDTPIMLKLPERFRSSSVVDERSKSPDIDDEDGTPVKKDAGGGKNFEKLTRFQAFGSISAAATTEDDGEDGVKADSLTSEPSAARGGDFMRAAAAREGFKQALKKPADERSVSFVKGSDANDGGSESVTSDVRDPAQGKFGGFTAFRAFSSGEVRSSHGSATEGAAVDEQRLAAPSKPSDEDSSSLFSTASQAIAKRVSPAVDPSTGNPPAPQQSITPTVLAPMGTAPPTASLAPPPERTAISPTTSVPQAAQLPKPFASYVVPATRTDEQPAWANRAAISGMGPSLVPDRGLGAAAVNAAAPTDSKILEIRETTEAVERLVRAFAHLRGVEPSVSAGERAAALVAEAGARGLHHVHGRMKSTSRTITTSDDPTMANSFSAARRRAEKSILLQQEVGGGDIGIHRMHEEMLESVIVDCVLDMMSNDFQRRSMPSKRPKSVKETQPFGSAQPARTVESFHETVTVDQYRRFTDPRADSGTSWKQGASTSRIERYDPYQVFESPFTTWRSPHGTSALGEGEQSLATLAHEALNKYVLRHLVLGTLHPPLVRLMLVDLMSACMDAGLRCFGTDDLSPATVPLVLIRFDGAEKDIPLATQVCHALPLEVVDSQHSADFVSAGGGEGGKVEPASLRRVFRLEHWVSRVHMWTIVKALQAALRQAEAIDADAYRTFKASNGHQRDVGLDADNQVFIPQERCLFSVLSVPGHQDPLSSDVQQRGGMSSSVPAVREAIDSPLSALVESVATTLPQHPLFDVREIDLVSALDQRECTVETIQELVNDVDIRRALEKRAAQKLLARALKRKEDNGNGASARRGERDRREEQLRILREAEERASRMVDEIRAEMASSSAPTKPKR